MSTGKKIGLWLFYYVLTFVISMVLVSIPDWFSGGAISVEGDRVDELFWATVVLSVAILSVVLATMIFAFVHFRAGRRDTSDGKALHGNATIEVTWTVIPFIIVSVLSVISYQYLVDNERVVEASERGDRGADTVEIDVVGYQFGWDFAYPQLKVATITNYVVPVDTTVAYNVTAKRYVTKPDGSLKPDVVHSYWVPASRIKQDAVPGYWADIQWTATKTGAYSLVCAELCGALHSQMLGEVCVVEKDTYASWLDELAAAAKSEDDAPTVAYPCAEEGDDTGLAIRTYEDDSDLLGTNTPEARKLLEQTLQDSYPHEEGDAEEHEAA